MTTEVKIAAGICGFATRVRSEDKGGYRAVFQLESDCPNWKQFNTVLGGEEISVMTGLLKALEVSVGLALPGDAAIVFAGTADEEGKRCSEG